MNQQKLTVLCSNIGILNLLLLHMMLLRIHVKLTIVIRVRMKQIVYSHRSRSSTIGEKIGSHVPLALDFDLSTAIEFVCLSILENVVDFFRNLKMLGLKEGKNLYDF